jgi:hypothetical protein
MNSFRQLGISPRVRQIAKKLEETIQSKPNCGVIKGKLTIFFNNTERSTTDTDADIRNFITGNLPDTNKLIIDYIVDYCYKGGFTDISQIATSDIILEDNNNAITLEFDGGKKRIDLIRNSHGRVTFIERFYVKGYLDESGLNSDEIREEGPENGRDGRPIAIGVTASTISLVEQKDLIGHPKYHIKHRLYDDKIYLLQEKGTKLFSSNHGTIQTRFIDVPVEKVEAKLNDEIALLVSPAKQFSSLRATLQKYVDSKDKSGSDQVKRDFFMEIIDLIDIDALTLSSLFMLLRDEKIDLKKLFYTVGNATSSGAAKHLGEIFTSLTGAKPSKSSMTTIVNGGDKSEIEQIFNQVVMSKWKRNPYDDNARLRLEHELKAAIVDLNDIGNSNKTLSQAIYDELVLSEDFTKFRNHLLIIQRKCPDFISELMMDLHKIHLNAVSKFADFYAVLSQIQLHQLSPEEQVVTREDQKNLQELQTNLLRADPGITTEIILDQYRSRKTGKLAVDNFYKLSPEFQQTVQQNLFLLGRQGDDAAEKTSRGIYLKAQQDLQLGQQEYSDKSHEDIIANLVENNDKLAVALNQKELTTNKSARAIIDAYLATGPNHFKRGFFNAVYGGLNSNIALQVILTKAKFYKDANGNVTLFDTWKGAKNSAAAKCIKDLFNLIRDNALNEDEFSRLVNQGELPKLAAYDRRTRTIVKNEIKSRLLAPSGPEKNWLGELVKIKYDEVQHKAPVLQRYKAEITQRFETIYQSALIENGLENAGGIPRFDPQGHIVTEVTLSLPSDSSMPEVLNLDREKLTTLCNLDIVGTPLEEKFEQWAKDQNQAIDLVDSDRLANAVDALMQSSSRSSIIPLQEEMEFHMRLSSRVIQKHLTPEVMQRYFTNHFNENVIPVTINELWQDIHNTAAQSINVKVKQVFQQALVESFKKGIPPQVDRLNIVKLNSLMDAQRRQLAHYSKIAFVEACDEVMKKNGGDFKALYDTQVRPNIRKEDFHKMTATGQDYLRTDASNNTALRIRHTDDTAHNKSKTYRADRPLYRTQYAVDADGVPTVAPLSQANVEVRIPSLALIDLDHDDSVYAVKKALAANYQGIKQRCGGYDGVMVYNLLTSLHTKFYDMTVDYKNRQRKSAARILKGSHLFNQEQLDKGNRTSLCYVQNIAVNQHTNNLGHDSFDDATAEATLMTEMAMLSTFAQHAADLPPTLRDRIGTESNSAYKSAHSHYLKFLRSHAPNELADQYFKDSQQGKVVIQQLTRLKAYLQRNIGSLHVVANVTPLPELATKVLLKMMATNLHWEKQYGMLVQSLSIFIEQASIAGCKTANERYQAVSNRVQLLTSINEKHNKGEPLPAFSADVITALERFLNSPLEPNNASPKALNELQKSLDTAYHHSKLHGAVNAVIEEDQPSKVPTNNNLFQHAKKMQAHHANHATQLNDAVAALVSPDLQYKSFDWR